MTALVMVRLEKIHSSSAQSIQRQLWGLFPFVFFEEKYEKKRDLAKFARQEQKRPISCLSKTEERVKFLGPFA